MLDAEELIICEFAVGGHLLGLFVCDVRVEPLRQIPRVFKRDDADTTPGLKIDEGGRHFAPIAEFECSLAQTATCDHTDRVRGAAINLNIGHEALAVCASWVVDVEQLETKQGHAHAKDLTGAHVPMRGFSFHLQFVEAFHQDSFDSKLPKGYLFPRPPQQLTLKESSAELA
jgi:hypothetical protein